MKYFSPSYWFKLWLLSAPLFNDETIGINAKSIDNKKIKDWASNNTNLQSINQDISFKNSSTNYQPYNLNQSTNQNINPFYQTYLEETSTHKHRHEKSRNRIKRQPNPNRPAPFWQYNLHTKQFGQLRNTYCGLAVIEGTFTTILAHRENIVDNAALERRLRDYMIANPLTQEQRQQHSNTDQFQNYLVARFNLNCRDDIENQGLEPSRIIEIINQLLGENRYTTQHFTPIRYHCMENNENLEILEKWRNINWTTETDEEAKEIWQNCVVSPTWNGISSSEWESRITYSESRSFSIFEQFYRTIFFDFLYSSITTSLSNNRPAIILFNYQPSNQYFSQANMGHYVLIDAIETNLNDRGEIRYRVLDPWNGVTEILTAHQLYYRGGNSFYIISDDNNTNHNFQNPLLNIRISEFLQNITSENTREIILQNFRDIINNTNLMLLFFIYPFWQYIDCNNRNRRSLYNNLKNKFCKIEENLNFPKKITSIAVLDESIKGDDLKAGDIYVGTDNGVYLIYNQGKKVEKFNINHSVKSIIVNHDGSAYVSTNNDKIYHLSINNELLTEIEIKTDNIALEQFNNLLKNKKDFEKKWNKNYGIITNIKKINDNSFDNFLKKDDLFFNTFDKNGYFIFQNQSNIVKVDNIYKDVTSLKVFNKNIYATTKNEEVYFFNTKKDLGRIIAEKVSLKIKSSDLNKELKLYYNDNHNKVTIENHWKNDANFNKIVKNFNLGKINLLNYQKIEFLGDIDNFAKSKMSWGDNAYYVEKTFNKFNGENFHNKIKNYKVNYDYEIQEKQDNLCSFVLQKWREEKFWSSNVEWYILFGLTWYWENENYYLQALSRQFAQRHGGSNNGGIWSEIGSGIRLYNDENVIKPEIPNSKEFYYNYDKSNIQIDFLKDYYNDEPDKNLYYKTLNLGKINPLNYQKIEFLGDIDGNCWGTLVNWGDNDDKWVYTNDCFANWGNPKNRALKGQSIKTFLRNRTNKFHDIIENTNNKLSSEKEQELQNFWDRAGLIELTVNQRFGLTWYWENENYMMKIWILQQCWSTFYANWDCHTKIGNGIRLYNDDPNSRNRREIFDINNLEEKPNKKIISNELKNITKWTNEFTKNINYEQHFPQIKNLSNYVGNNITNL